MLHVVNNIEPCLQVEYENQLLGILGIDKVCEILTLLPYFDCKCATLIMDSKSLNQILITFTQEMVDDCCKLILEMSSSLRSLGNKRKFGSSMPGSPNGVIDISFSSDSSNDSWAVASSVSSSPEPVSKKTRALEKLNHTANAATDIFSLPR